MSIPHLSVISAGAGSGKTHHIQTTLAKWIMDGAVAPDRIVAVTFTEAAASEMRGRIRAQLVQDGLLEEALRLDQSYISTIHGFGLRLSTEFAFDAGTSPYPRLLKEDEENASIRMALADTHHADPILRNLKKFGYIYNHTTKKGPEDVFREHILKFTAQLRSIGRVESGSKLMEFAFDWIRNGYGPTQEAAPLNEAIIQAVENLTSQFNYNLGPKYANSKAARNQLSRDFRNLRAAQDADRLVKNWSLWQGLRKLRCSNRSTTLPDGYDQLANKIIDAADHLPQHPGPLEDAIDHLAALFGTTDDALGKYAESKQKDSQMDFTDMLLMPHDLLVNHPEVLSSLAKRIDCLVIDEFQDTNPLQFSLLWAIHEAGVPALIVGDLKQAIMGFQNADYRLMERLIQTNPQDTDSLKENWRSQESLLEFVNSLGPGLFGDAYTALTPRGPSGFQEPLELVHYPKLQKYGRNKNELRAAYTATRIKDLISGGNQFIRDRRSGEKRPLRSGDIAVLCRTNRQLAIYANALRDVGLRCRIAEEGWHQSRVVEIARHAIEYVADPTDRHAALYLSVTDLGGHSLQEAINELIETDSLAGDLLSKLEPIITGPKDRMVSTYISEIISALNLFETISEWPDGEQARANLVRLIDEAKEFETSKREILSSGGFYGAGLKTFLSWLAAKSETEDEQPDPRVIDEESVQLFTWHKSKGKEWPIVAVCALESDYKEKLPSLNIDYDNFTDLNSILNEARIQYSPVFAAPETNHSFINMLQESNEKEARRLLYVALTRAREKLILEWPSHLDGKDGETFYNLLRDSTGISFDGNSIQVGQKNYACHITQASTEWPDGFRQSRNSLDTPLPTSGRRAIEIKDVPQDLTPDTIIPSNLEGTSDDVPSAPLTEIYLSDPGFDFDLPGIERGTLLHRCFEILGSSLKKASLLGRATKYSFTPEQIKSLEAAVESFESWLSDRFEPIQIDREVNFLSLNSTRCIVAGLIDLLVETENGYWIIDHKSDRTEDLDSAFIYYWPQIEAYANSVSAAQPEKPVLGAAINWISHGNVMLIELDK